APAVVPRSNLSKDLSCQALPVWMKRKQPIPSSNRMSVASKALFLVLAVYLCVVCGAVKAGAEEQYLMDGKVVPKEFFDASPLVNEGTALLRSNRNKEAADKLAQAVQIAPTFPDAHHDYALALVKLGKPQEAIKEFKTALSLNPNLSSAWLSL